MNPFKNSYFILNSNLFIDSLFDEDENLNLQIGFSHDVNFKIPKDIKITVEKQTIIKIIGVDKELVSKIAADIKNLKPVEPYKAKGIKERGQFVLRKEGKKK